MFKLKLARDEISSKPLSSEYIFNIKGMRKQNLPYIFIWLVYYAWVIIFATWWTASPLTENIFGTEFRNLLHSLNLVSSAFFIFIIKKEWFIKTARAGSILIIAGMAVFLLASNAYVQLSAAVVIGISLGCVNASILMPFVFTLNNTEKLYALVGSNILINLLLLFINNNSDHYLHSNTHLIVSFVILVIALSAILFFKNIPADQVIINNPEIDLKIYWTLFFSCVFVFICKGAGKGILNLTAANAADPILTWYYAGGLAGCLIYYAIYISNQKSIHLAWNIAFGSLAIGLLCNAFAVQMPVLAAVFAILLGIGNTIGMINVYYILGVVGRKYNSMHYLRLSILFIGICGGISGVAIGNLIDSINSFEISILASIISAATVILFLILSPVLAQTHYGNAWAEDSGKMDIENHPNLFAKYELSKRETEVCKLLLQGYTLRQISAILSISYSTVNTYCTSLYRKLKINSRIELLIHFKDYIEK
ncbi:MAG: helix-turn-helix transcriptional regulator [Syntrophomonas sp.]|nr:helix-turn-helix transcriptional regulator [Syntrophomonas sp.]